MTRTPRSLFGLAVLLLLAVFVLPLWHIDLEAPQYPEGIGLVINVNALDGQAPGNLDSINGLNHYIGMKAIDPEAIPELKILPWAFGVLVLVGLGAVAANRRPLYWLWIGLFALVMGASMVRFYQWGYDYGHNLDPTAAIQVPGMSYQPPVIGSKKLLNFTAHSWPAAGGYAAALSFVLGAAALWLDRRRPRLAAAPVAALLVGAGLWTGCLTDGPQPIDYGVAECTHCRMTVSDERFAAQIVTKTGKAEPFDSIECMVNYLADHGGAAADARGVYVANYAAPGDDLVPAAAAFFLRSGAIASPMGGGLAAFSAASDRDEALARLGGEALAWADVQRLSVQPTHAHR